MKGSTTTTTTTTTQAPCNADRQQYLVEAGAPLAVVVSGGRQHVPLVVHSQGKAGEQFGSFGKEWERIKVDYPMSRLPYGVVTLRLLDQLMLLITS
ncbi:hypothetical protein E2C01_014404 [Portunus trituberculatus]|uniref:Uncharacterized protein n=1 Tax=Portunus trituberculatus TaxID=210409 RepID=A0A5B7DK24_PORTR|nr:hypothetical protein [Portunus trituberculatus]